MAPQTTLSLSLIEIETLTTQQAGLLFLSRFSIRPAATFTLIAYTPSSDSNAYTAIWTSFGAHTPDAAQPSRLRIQGRACATPAEALHALLETTCEMVAALDPPPMYTDGEEGWCEVEGTEGRFFRQAEVAADGAPLRNGTPFPVMPPVRQNFELW